MRIEEKRGKNKLEIGLHMHRPSTPAKEILMPL
jgi:hypothetical protein